MSRLQVTPTQPGPGGDTLLLRRWAAGAWRATTAGQRTWRSESLSSSPIS